MGKIVKTALTFAAVGAITVATGGGASFLGISAASGSFLGATGIAGAALAGSALGAGLGVLSKITAPSAAAIDSQTGQKFTVTTSAAYRNIVYGENRIGGSLFFIEEYDSNGGNDVPNDTLVIGRVVADHEVQGFGTFYLGDQAISFDGSGNATTAPYVGKLFLKTYDGSQTTGADPWITAADANWDSTHVGRKTAYYVIKAIFDPEVFPYGANELLNSSIVVQGKKVYDPRLDSTQTAIGGSGSHRIDNESTWAYSTNPALCIYDYMRDERQEANAIPAAEIDVASIASAANTCDESVSVVGGGTISRYTLAGVVERPGKLQNLDEMLTSMAGRRMWLGGKFYLFAGEPIAASVSIGDADIKEAVYRQLPVLGSRVNQVQGLFVDPANNYEQQEYPAHGDGTAQADEGLLTQQLNLPWTRDHRIAQRLAKIMLKEARLPTLTLVCKRAAIVVAPMDVIAVTSSELGLSSENFRLIKQSIDPKSGTVTLELVKEDASTYSWTAASDEYARSAGNALTQPTGRTAFDPTNVTVTAAKLSSLGGLETAVLEVGWDDPGPLVRETRVDYRLNGDTTWIPYGSAFRGDTNMTLQLPQNTTWDIRVYHVMTSGVISENPHVETATTTDSTNIADAIDNFNTRNDRNGAAIVTPTIASDGTAVDHTLATDGSANVSFEWSWSGDEDDIDGWIVYVRQSTSSSSYTFGSSPAEEQTFPLPIDRRAFFLFGVPADQYLTFGIRAFRKVDQDIDASGLVLSTLVQPGLSAEAPYRPSANVAFTGNVTGTIQGTLSATVVSNASNGATAYTGTTLYRTTGAPTNNPSPNGITITTNTNGTINIKLQWAAYTHGAKQADMLIVFWRQDGTAPTVNDAAVTFNVNTAASSYYIFEGVNPAGIYSFGIAAARRTENGIEIGTIQAPTSSPDWRGVTSGTPDYTANINGVAASSLTTTHTNFNSRNDRNGAAITSPTIATDGTAVDHTINTDGSANVSLEWSWSGGNNTIDGWTVYIYQASGSGAYTMGSSPAAERTIDVRPGKRAVIIYGVPANMYYTFGVQAYRVVDPDVNANEVITSSIIQPSIAGENPYRPSSSVAFAGNVSGTVNGIAAANVNVWAEISGTGKPDDYADVTGDNESAFILNFDFEQGSVHWSLAASWSIVSDGSNALDGSYVLKRVANGTQTAATASRYVPTAVGRRWKGSIHAKQVSANGTLKVRLFWYDTSKSAISNTQEIYTIASTYDRYDVIGVAPSGAAFVRLAVVADSHTTGTYYVDNARIEPMPADLPEIDEVRGGAIDSTGRLTDATVIRGVQAGGLQSAFSVNPITGSTDVGSTASISLQASTLYIGTTTVSYPSGSVSGLSFTTTYHIYRDDPNLSGAGTYTATTSLATAVGGEDRIYFGSYTTVADGGGGGGSDPPLGCVCTDQYLMSGLLAGDVAPGSPIDLLRENGLGVERSMVDSVEFSSVPCVRITTESGIVLRCSTKTPLTLEGGAVLESVMQGRGCRVPVIDERGFRYEAIKEIRYIGHHRVAHIHVGGRTYAAGADPKRRILTHNPVKP